MPVALLRSRAPGNGGGFRRAAIAAGVTTLAVLAAAMPASAASVRFVQAPPDGAEMVAGQSGVRFEVYWTIDTSGCGPLAAPSSRVYVRGPLPDGPELNTALRYGVTDLQAEIEVPAPAVAERYGYRVGLRCWPLGDAASTEIRTFQVLPVGAPPPDDPPPPPDDPPQPDGSPPPPEDSPAAGTFPGGAGPPLVRGSVPDNPAHAWVERVVNRLRAHRITSRSRAQRVRAYRRLQRDAGNALAALRATDGGQPLASCTIAALRHGRRAAAIGIRVAVRRDGRAPERRIARRTAGALDRLEACL